MLEIKNFLKHVEMFIGLNDEMLAKVANICQPKVYDANSIIVKRNDPPDNFYLIEYGTVEIITTHNVASANTDNGVVVSLGNGQSFGEMGLVDSGLRSATVKAATDTRLLIINCQLFRDLCEADTTLGYQIMKNIAADLSFKLRHRNLI